MKTSFVSPQRFVQVVSEAERSAVGSADFSWVRDMDSLSCHRGVWDEGVRFDPDQRQSVILDTERTDSCFFWRYQPGTLLQAATELQARESESHEAKRGRRLTVISLAIGALGVVVAFLSIASAHHWWPF